MDGGRNRERCQVVLPNDDPHSLHVVESLNVSLESALDNWKLQSDLSAVVALRPSSLG